MFNGFLSGIIGGIVGERLGKHTFRWLRSIRGDTKTGTIIGVLGAVVGFGLGNVEIGEKPTEVATISVDAAKADTMETEQSNLAADTMAGGVRLRYFVSDKIVERPVLEKIKVDRTQWYTENGETKTRTVKEDSLVYGAATDTVLKHPYMKLQDETAILNGDKVEALIVVNGKETGRIQYNPKCIPEGQAAVAVLNLDLQNTNAGK